MPRKRKPPTARSRRMTRADVEQVLQLRASGLSYQAIAALTGWGKNAIRYRVVTDAEDFALLDETGEVRERQYAQVGEPSR